MENAFSIDRSIDRSIHPSIHQRFNQTLTRSHSKRLPQKLLKAEGAGGNEEGGGEKGARTGREWKIGRRRVLRMNLLQKRSLPVCGEGTLNRLNPISRLQAVPGRVGRCRARADSEVRLAAGSVRCGAEWKLRVADNAEGIVCDD
jgi:hypothetical protein